jgi:hypothetical protein
MSSRIDTNKDCFCCGTPEGSGCAKGPRCRCDTRRKCEICMHCLDHHVKNCTGDVWTEHMELMAELRARHGINVFDVGEVKNVPLEPHTGEQKG